MTCLAVSLKGCRVVSWVVKWCCYEPRDPADRVPVLCPSWFKGRSVCLAFTLFTSFWFQF